MRLFEKFFKKINHFEIGTCCNIDTKDSRRITVDYHGSMLCTWFLSTSSMVPLRCPVLYG